MDAKQVATMLIPDAGFRPAIRRPLAMARHLQPLGMLMGQIANVRSHRQFR
jgi:predicted dinucleotide-binding enzyme